MSRRKKHHGGGSLSRSCRKERVMNGAPGGVGAGRGQGGYSGVTFADEREGQAACEGEGLAGRPWKASYRVGKSCAEVICPMPGRRSVCSWMSLVMKKSMPAVMAQAS